MYKENGLTYYSREEVLQKMDEARIRHENRKAIGTKSFKGTFDNVTYEYRKWVTEMKMKYPKFRILNTTSSPTYEPANPYGMIVNFTTYNTR